MSPMEDDDLAGLRLLVVEDDALVRNAIVRTARAHGLAVDKADGSAPATALLADGHYDIVITDLKMPAVSGRAVMDRVREAERVTGEPGPA